MKENKAKSSTTRESQELCTQKLKRVSIYALETFKSVCYFGVCVCADESEKDRASSNETEVNRGRESAKRGGCHDRNTNSNNSNSTNENLVERERNQQMLSLAQPKPNSDFIYLFDIEENNYFSCEINDLL